MRLRHASLAFLLLGACRPAPAVPPSTQFLLFAGDSTFWVRTGPQGMRVRTSPIRLARVGGRFVEVYTADDDRSFMDASIIGQRIFTRDILTGDSLLVFDDTMMAGVANWYQRTHPDDRALPDDEEAPEDPAVEAASDIRFLGQLGPYFSYEYRAEALTDDGGEWRMVRRGVLDLRTGRAVSVRDIVGPGESRALIARGRELYAQTLDSVLASRDSRAPEAALAVQEMDFDSTSFTLVSENGSLSIQFAVPGHGPRAGGVILPLSPIPTSSPAWWAELRPSLPQGDGVRGETRWMFGRDRVIARELPGGGSLRLSVRDAAGLEWPVAAFPTPAWQLVRLDAPPTDSTTLRALARAFDEAALYDEDARTAMTPSPSAQLAATRARRPVRDSQHETSELMMPQHENVLGHVFGGVILSMVDRAAAVSAIRHSRSACVTVSVDRVDFREPIHVGDLVIMKTSVNFAGRTSMEVGVRVEAENMVSGVRRHTNSCYLTFVAIDRNGRPVEVPEVVPESEMEQRRYAAAQERRRRRLEERQAEEG